MKISLIQPSRNNLKYLQWSYNAIRKNQGQHDVQITVADDASTDGTWDWCLETMRKDLDFQAIRNNTGERLGHTILYDTLVNEVARYDVCMIYHADMYLLPGALDHIEERLKEKTIVSLTRIEPPLHPPGPEKILMDFGVEPEEFEEEKLLEWFQTLQQPQLTKITEGVFAPWAFWKKDFQHIGGHDPVYAPQSKEDSDIFNRFQLSGIKFIQTWGGCVYHMTCRGSRRNTLDKAKNIYEDSPEWLAQNERSSRNFVRKWGHFVKHDAHMKPIIPHKYNIGFILQNGTPELLSALEPWCDTLYYHHPFNMHAIEEYVAAEQENTLFNLGERVKTHEAEKKNDILIKIDGNKFSHDDFRLTQQLPEVLAKIGTAGLFQLSNLQIEIKELKTYEKDLIHCE